MADLSFGSRNTTPLTDADIAEAAKTLGCDPAAIKAVSEVEAPHGGFLADGRPTILFESHAFHKLTNGQYDGYSGISTPSWVHNYGPGAGHQYDRLEQAMKLDREAALKSCSWGKYQIMGSNFSEAGFDNVEAFVADMVDSEGYQLDAFVAFIQNADIDAALRAHDWAAFARHYNGPGQVQAYAERIAQDYAAEHAEYADQLAAAHVKYA